MIYKVFYQETKDQSPRRENTTLYTLILTLLTNLRAVLKHVNSLKNTLATTLSLSSYFLTNTSITKKRLVFLN